MLSLGIILWAADLFTNSIEWVGHKLHFNEGIVGSVLAAVGTALPETLIPIVAVFLARGVKHGHDVGMGAILGAPFMLSTLAMFVTGLAVVLYSWSGRRATTLSINPKVLWRDVRFFLAVYLVAVAAAFFASPAIKVIIALGFLLIYVFYVYRHAIEGGELIDANHLSPLHFARNADNPPLALVILQVLAGLGLMMGGAYLFVNGTSAVAETVRLPALILSLIIAPIATELPEKCNSILWVRDGKDTLALGNITGAMVFQSCIPVSFGLIFTDWSVTTRNLDGFVSAAIALGATTFIFGTMSWRGRLTAPLLLTGGLWYLLYLSYLVIR